MSVVTFTCSPPTFRARSATIPVVQTMWIGCLPENFAGVALTGERVVVSQAATESITPSSPSTGTIRKNDVFTRGNLFFDTQNFVFGPSKLWLAIDQASSPAGKHG